MQVNSINYLRIHTNVIQVEKMKIDNSDHIEGLGNGERERERLAVRKCVGSLNCICYVLTFLS